MVEDVIARMSDSAAVRALSAYHNSFVANEPALAVRLHQELGMAVGKGEVSQEWLDTKLENVSQEQGEAARFALTVLAASDARGDIETIVTAVESNASGYAVDPITLSIGGVIAIGLVLASRVKKIGDAEFYEGVPEEVGGILGKLAGFFGN